MTSPGVGDFSWSFSALARQTVPARLGFPCGFAGERLLLRFYPRPAGDSTDAAFVRRVETSFLCFPSAGGERGDGRSVADPMPPPDVRSALVGTASGLCL